MELIRVKTNPILKPISSHFWEAKAVFNPAVIYLEGKIHLIYRAMSKDNVSSFGYARFKKDGITLEKRLRDPIFSPQEPFETRLRNHHNTGCEDPRITLIGNKIYMCYVAVDGKPKVALTSIKKEDFLKEKWNWEKPIVISKPRIMDKNACVIKLKNRFAFFHRLENKIWIDVRENLNFFHGQWIEGKPVLFPRKGKWDSKRVGIAGPPIKTKYGWLLIYHGADDKNVYRLGAALLDLRNPLKVLSRSNSWILEPEENYEKRGQVPNVIFSCGTALVFNKLFLYYGAADKVIGLAVGNFKILLEKLKKKEL